MTVEVDALDLWRRAGGGGVASLIRSKRPRGWLLNIAIILAFYWAVQLYQGHVGLFDGGVEVVAPFGPGAGVGLEAGKAEGLEGDVDQCRVAVALAVADQLFLRIEAGLFDDSAQLRLGT